MITSESINELTKALALAQGQINPAAMDATNPFLKSKYATLNSIWSACRKPLSDNGLSVIQAPTNDENGRLWLVTRICHTSGEWIESKMEIAPADNKIQSVGAAITYGRRYMLGAMVGITTDEDDDGQNDTTRNAKQNGKPRQKRTSEPPQSDPSKWLPDLAEFRDTMVSDFKMDWDEIKAILKKDCGITGFKPEAATDAYNCLAQVVSDRKRKSAKMPQTEAIPATGEQEPLFPDEPEPDHSYDE